MNLALGVASVLLYVAATALLSMRLISSDYAHGPVRGGLAGATALALGLHGLLLYHGVVTDGGLNLGVFNAASLVAWVVALVVLVAAISRPLDNLGIFTLPVAAITVVLSLAFPGERAVLAERGLEVDLHIAISILAYSVLTIAACQALLLAYQEHRLRRKRPGHVLRILPPMQTQEALLFQMIGLGFFLLSLSLLSGVMFLEDIFAQHLVHKTALSILAWAVFATLLWGRWRHGWRGRTVIRWALAGFVVLLLAYFGSKLVLEVLLDRAWVQ